MKDEPKLSDEDRGDRGDVRDGAGDPRSLTHLAHDIRAAMSDVIGGLRLLEPDRLDAQTRTQIDRVQSAADTLASLVDHVLLEAAGERPMTQDRGPVVLEPWLAGIMHRWHGRATEQGRVLRITRSGDLPAHVKVSPVALTRLVGNLVSNALRHTQHGEVEVQVAAADGALEIHILDEGDGFPIEVLHGERPAQPSATAGSGLGLGIARGLSEELGIALDLSNHAGGACARLRLGPDLLEATPRQVETEQVSLAGLRVLVAEDNLTNQTILRMMLEKLGAEAEMVGDGRAALGALMERPFDIALLDIEMPEMSGLEVMEQVRALPGEAAAMPLVAITAYVLRDNREAIYAAGADGIIGKPVPTADDLGRAILRYVSNEPLPEGPDPLGDVQGGAEDAAFLDHACMDRLLEAAGPEGRGELLRHLSDDLQETLRAMERAVADHDADELRAQTHILIAISGAVGADRLCHYAEALNIAAKRRSAERSALLLPAIRTDLVALMEEVTRRRGQG